MLVGCVLTAGASQLRYVWHGLFDNILKPSVSLLCFFFPWIHFLPHCCEKIRVRGIRLIIPH